MRTRLVFAETVTYDEIFAKVLSYVGKLLNLKGLKLGQILRTDKIGFRRLGHIYVRSYVDAWLLHYVICIGKNYTPSTT